jgi:hypothetical protein
MSRHIADLFKDKALGEKMRRDGFVTVPLLDESELQELENIFGSHESKDPINLGFYTSIWSEDTEYRKKIDANLKRILMPPLSKHLDDIKAVFTNFMVKNSGENTALVLHQDWSFVDEPEFDSATIWCPLVDVNRLNGTLQVIPRSHLLENYVRGRFFDAPFRQVDEATLQKQLIDVPLKAGEALIINSRLIHGSPPNLSGKQRLVASVVVAPEEAPLHHWVMEQKAEGTLQKKLDINADFFWEYSCYDKLESLSSQLVKPYSPAKLNERELQLLAPQKTPLNATGVVSKLKSLWQR